MKVKLIILGEDFDPKSLAICDYLNRSTGEARFSTEFWKYTIHDSPSGQEGHCLFLLEQVLPPPSVRREIEEKREASKAGKYARDPARINFMKELLAYIWDACHESNEFNSWRNPGQSYACQIESPNWTDDARAVFRIDKGISHPRLYLPHGWIHEGLMTDLAAGKDGEQDYLEFSNLETDSLTFNTDFGSSLLGALRRARPRSGQ